MATSTAQAIATVPVWDYLMAPGDPMSTNPKGLSGRRVKISLTYGLSQSASPVTLLDTEPVGVATDGNGFWQANLVPNNKISPSGTLYTVEIEGYRSYMINVTDVAAPAIGWQSSAIAVLPPISGAAGYTLPGGTSVLGGLTIAPGETGLDTNSAGALVLGDNVATSIELGTSTLAAKDFRRSFQSITEAVLVSGIDPTGGEIVAVTLTANRVVGLPLSPVLGQRIELLVTQNGAGGWTLTWPGGIKTAWQPVPTANSTTTLAIEFDGTNWQAVAGQVPVSNLGVLSFPGPIAAQSFTATSSPYAPSANAPAGGAVYGASVFIGGPNPWIDVKSDSVKIGVTTYTLGAKGDGVTNDTTALQNAETAASANGAKIFYPTGTYIINAQITLNASNVSHAGAGRYAAVIKRANATNAHMFHCTSAVNAEFLDMGFDENGANNATTPHGIWMDQNSSSVLVERCQFINCDGFAVYVFSSNPPVRVTNLRVVDCEFVQNTTGTHDLVTVMSNGGAVIGNRFTIGGVNAGLCLYELNDVPCTDNVFVGQGTGAKLVQIASVLGCTFVANTILCGANDICIWLICENDNASNRNCIDTVIQGNTIRNSGANTNGSTGIFCNGGTQANKTIQSTIIADNIFDAVGLPIYYFAGTITGVRVHHNDFTGCNTPIVNRNVVPTDEAWDHNRAYNPLTVTTPAVSTPLTNTFAVDIFVSFIANAAGTTFTVNGKALAATPANAQSGFYWPANTVASYVNAPASWAFIGL